MSGGQHRDDEGNGPSQSGERDGTEPTAANYGPSIERTLLRQCWGVLRKSKNEDETFLTGPTSLEMFSTVIWKQA